MVGLSAKPVFGAPTDETDKQKFHAYYDKMIPFLNKRLTSHSKPFVGGTNSLSIADLKVYQGFTAILEIEANPAPAADKEAVKQKIAQHPRLDNYLKYLKV